MDWLEFAKYVGGPMFILVFIGWGASHYYLRLYVPHKRKMDGIQAEKEVSQVELNKVLSENIPVISANTSEVSNQVRSLHKRHDTTHQKVKEIEGKIQYVCKSKSDGQ